MRSFTGRNSLVLVVKMPLDCHETSPTISKSFHSQHKFFCVNETTLPSSTPSISSRLSYFSPHATKDALALGPHYGLDQFIRLRYVNGDFVTTVRSPLFG